MRLVSKEIVDVYPNVTPDYIEFFEANGKSEFQWTEILFVFIAVRVNREFD